MSAKWDGNERRTDDHASRISTLEAWGKINSRSIATLEKDIRSIKETVEDIRREIHGARTAGKVGLAVAIAFGSLIAWIVQTVLKG
jgi:hypothetical protein